MVKLIEKALGNMTGHHVDFYFLKGIIGGVPISVFDWWITREENSKEYLVFGDEFDVFPWKIPIDDISHCDEESYVCSGDLIIFLKSGQALQLANVA